MATGGNTSSGFTIVETLIVLAVSGFLAVSVLLLVNGRQNKTHFQVAATSLKQEMEQIVNETRNGYYPSNSDFTCNGLPAKPMLTSATPGSVAQGTNSSCIFLGKAIQFGIAPDGSTDNASESYSVYPLIAKRLNSTNQEVRTFPQASPIALARDSAHSDPGDPYPDYAVHHRTKNGLALHHAGYLISSLPGLPGTYTQNNAAGAYVVFALVDDLGKYTADLNGNLSSATQTLNLYDYDLDNGKWPAPKPSDSFKVVDNINKGIHVSGVVKAVQLCFNSGGTNQSVLITLSGEGRLGITNQIFGKKDCTA